MSPPIVAITECRKPDDYARAVEETGSSVRVVDPSTAIATALDGVGALLLTGGDDVSPERYGEDRHPSVVEVAAARDEFEIALTAEALRRDLPILAICRGVQVLNVARGGSLVQDIPSQIAGAIEHSPPQLPPWGIGHEVRVESHSLLAELMRDRLIGTDRLDVNSRHHQSVKVVAPGFRIVATALDGVIEAIEEPHARFCLGVQWHPENFWRTGEFRSLFAGFVAAALRRTSDLRRT